MVKTVVLIKTHIWNDDIEKFADKIYNDTHVHNIDFFILMHDEKNELSEKIQSPDIKNITLRFTEQDIKQLYSVGFYSMWLSNHWILMWFFKQFGHKYDYFWSMEYDVRISGNSVKIWNYESNYDFLYTMGNNINSMNVYNNHYIGGKLSELQKYHGYLQLVRYSGKALEYLNKCFEEGENGQDELITFSLLNRGNFSGSKKFLQSLIRGTWTWQDKFSVSNRKLYNKLETRLDDNHLCIFHPVK